MGKEFKTCANRIVGRGHIPQNVPCQDSVLSKTESGVTAAILSDGCGSAILSEYGSQLTIEGVAEFVFSKFDALYALDDNTLKINLLKMIAKKQFDYIEQHKEEIIKLAIERQHLEREERRLTPEQIEALSTAEMTRFFFGTFCMIAIKDNKCLACQIGDGKVCAIIDNELRVILQEQKNGEVNATIYPVQILGKFQSRNKDPETLKDVRIVRLENMNIQGGLVMSDGLDNLVDYVDKDKELFFRYRLLPYFANAFYETMDAKDQEEAENLMLTRLERGRKTTSDDCSMALFISDLPENPNDLVLAITTKPHEENIETKIEEEIDIATPKEDDEDYYDDEEEEEEVIEDIVYASDIYSDLFDDVISFVGEDVYDVLDSIQEYVEKDETYEKYGLEAIVNAYHFIIIQVKKHNNYYYRKADMPEAVFSLIKECDTVLSWPNNGVTKKVCKK